MTAQIKIPNLKSYTLHDYQELCYAAISNEMRNYEAPFIIDCTVGAGKTVISAAVLARCQELNWPAMIITRQGELVEQNAECYWECGVKNSIYSASLGVKSTHYPVIVGTEGTIVNALDTDLKDFLPRVIGVDESHMLNYDDPESQYMRIINHYLEKNEAWNEARKKQLTDAGRGHEWKFIPLIIFGMTGSPFRGSESIVGHFWKKCIYKISTEELVMRGFLVPTIFGVGDTPELSHDFDLHYDLSEFKPDREGTEDLSAAQMAAQEEKIVADIALTEKIMREVVALTATRNCVMITGAGRKHLEQIASFLPAGTWAIITDETPKKERREALKQANLGNLKYLLQIGCLTTGVNIPLIDTMVIMRKIGSLTLLIQLLGRGMRTLKPWMIESGFIKHDNLVLDYSETMEAMSEIYHDPILEAAVAAKDAAKKDIELIECPVCYTKNSPRARRCSNRPVEIDGKQRLVRVEGGVLEIENYSIDGRCEWFFADSYVACKSCNTPNDRMARDCRQCGHTLIDPNKNLVGKHYTDDDWRVVKKMEMRLTKDGNGLLVSYLLEGEPAEGAKVWDGHEQATEIFYPNKKEKWAQGTWADFKRKHCHKDFRSRIDGKSTKAILAQQAVFDVPARITHRVKEGGKSIIHRKEFLSGRVAE